MSSYYNVNELNNNNPNIWITFQESFVSAKREWATSYRTHLYLMILKFLNIKHNMIN